MKKSALLAAALLAGLTYFLLREPRPDAALELVSEVPVPPVPVHVEAPAPAPDPSVVVPPVSAPVSPVLDVVPVWTPEAGPALEPAPAMEALGMAVRNFGQRFKGNPVGNNQEITAALAGDNPQGVIFLDTGRDRINGRGELVDGWGTPYFFHQLSGTEMEIHSAGPDRQRGTADDLVVR